jgi:thymidylate synthase
MNPEIIVGEYATAVWLNAILALTERGRRVSPRGIGTVELRPAILVLENPRMRWVEVPERKLSKRLGYLEALMLLAGVSYPDLLMKAAPHYSNFVNPGTGELDGAYGPRVGPQLPYVRDLLRRDPDTRQAVVTVFGPADHHESLDVPCTVSLHFMVRDGALELITYMRSNDVWLGWPYDVVMFTVLQEALATDLGLGLGQYTHVDGSLHLYDTNRDKVDRIIHSSWRIMRALASPGDAPMPDGATLEELQAYAVEALAAYRRSIEEGSTTEYVLQRGRWFPPFFDAAIHAMLKGKGA